MKIGVLGLQGGVVEHVFIARKALENLGYQGEVVVFKKPSQLQDLDVIIIPGGESTVIGRLMERLGLIEPLRDKLFEGTPCLGTCAGMVLLAKKIKDRVLGEVKQPSLAVMDVEVVRNLYGRQRESFEIDLKIPVLGDKPFRGVFIRAPAVTRLWGTAESLAELDGVTVFARQGAVYAAAFHPELTDDTRIHELVIKEAKR